MRNSIFSVLILLPGMLVAQKDSVLSNVYHWKEPARQINQKILSSTLFEGVVQDMAWLQMSANSITAELEHQQDVPANEECLMIVKSGMLTVKVKDSSFTIGAGSIILLMPGEKYSLKHRGITCDYYEIRYRSKHAIDKSRSENAGGSIVMDWNNIPFIPNNKGGGRRNFFERPTVMSRRLEMHVTSLKEGTKSHDPHKHAAEEIVLVVNGKTDMQIGDKFYKGGEGSVYYLGSNVLHALTNDGTGPCTYFAFQFE